MRPEEYLQKIRVVLCRTSHPGNIGAAARAMKTMGLSTLSLVKPQIFPSDEANARATGAVDLLQQAGVFECLEDALADCSFAIALSARPRDLAPEALPLRSAVSEIVKKAASNNVALVFGNEANGLSNEEIQLCQKTATIPTVADFSSLNLGAAVQVLCYECRMAAFFNAPPKARDTATPFSSPAASFSEVEGLMAHLESLMTTTGFFNPAEPGRLLPKLRRLFARAHLEKSEVNILRGILASVETPTRHGKM